MKFENPKCPKCGDDTLLRGTVDTIPGTALLSDPDDDGNYEYAGQTDVFWDGQRTNTNSEGAVELECSEGHRWFSQMEE